MAYVGTRRLFEEAGFAKVSSTGSVLNGFPRVLMRRGLHCHPGAYRNAGPHE